MKELISSAVNTHPSPTLPSYFNSVHRSHICIQKITVPLIYVDRCTCLSETRVLEGWHNTNTAPAPHGWQGLKRPNRARGGSELLAPLSRTAELSSIFTFCGFQASGCTVYCSKCAVNGKVGFQVQPPAQHQQLSTESIFARATFCMNRMLLNEHMNSVH